MQDIDKDIIKKIHKENLSDPVNEQVKGLSLDEKKKYLKAIAEASTEIQEFLAE